MKVARQTGATPVINPASFAGLLLAHGRVRLTVSASVCLDGAHCPGR